VKFTFLADLAQQSFTRRTVFIAETKYALHFLCLPFL